MSRALGAGARLMMKVAGMPYGDRQGGVADPSENIWWISQRLAEEPYEAGA
jgi:PhnB protein